MQNQQFTTTNTKAPNSAQSHVVVSSDTASVNVIFGDFRSIEFSGVPFNPQGAYIDNTKSAAALNILLQPINYTITVPAGQMLQTSFPSPASLTYQITGGGDFNIFWVDYPVFASGSSSSGGGGGVTTFKPLTNFYGFIGPIAGGSLTLNLGGVNNYNLNALQIFASPNTEIMGSVNNIVQITAYIGSSRAGQVIFSKYMIFPTSLSTSQTGNEYMIADLVFEEGLGFALGTNDIYLEIWDPNGHYLTQLNPGILTMNAMVSAA